MPRARSKFRSPEALAMDLLGRYHGTLPIDVESIAADLGCTVSAFDLQPEVSGLLIREHGATLITVNEDDPAVRRRFTVAHEIGHLIMHPGRPLLVDADVRVNARRPKAGFATQLEETEANQFAAALLMPAVLVHSELEKFRDGKETINQTVVKKMARRFDVSDTAMQYRLINLGLHIPH